LPGPGGSDWFRDAFGETDASFSLIDNAREASVLAAGLLEGAAADGKIYAALATLTAAASGLRTPDVRPDLIDMMRLAIQEKAIGARQQEAADPQRIKPPAATKISAELTALIQAPEIGKASTLLKQVSEESAEIARALVDQMRAVFQPLTAQVLTLREEVEMLWWHIGGWSRLLDKPFADIDLGLAAVLAGIDMADMSQSATGPVAAPAIFQRTLTLNRKPKTVKIAIKDVVDALPKDRLDHLQLPNALGTAAPDICPVLTAFWKAKEIGASPAWHASFAKATGLDAGSTFAPLDLAVQSYRERLLLRSLV
jgi:hypothetical protein